MQPIVQSKIGQMFVVILSLLIPQESHTQLLSVRASAGFVHLPLSDWSKFFGNLDNAIYYQKNNPNVYFALSLNYALPETHSFSLGTELIRSSASLSTNSAVLDWKFQGIPLSIGYEYRFAPFNERFLPVAGIGVSYFLGEVKAKDYIFNQTLKRSGSGYGVHGTVGLISEISQSLSVISHIRYRYSNGMAFSDNPGDVKVEFTGFDFSTGLSWTF